GVGQAGAVTPTERHLYVGPGKTRIEQRGVDCVQSQLPAGAAGVATELGQPSAYDRDSAAHRAASMDVCASASTVANLGTGSTATSVTAASLSSSAKSVQSRTASPLTPSGSSTYPTANGTNPPSGTTYGGDFGANLCTVKPHTLPWLLSSSSVIDWPPQLWQLPAEGKATVAQSPHRLPVSDRPIWAHASRGTR